MSKYYVSGYTPPGNITSKQGVKALQASLGVKADGIWGKQTQAAYDAYLRRAPYQQARNTKAAERAVRLSYAEPGYTPPTALQSSRDVKRVQAGLGISQTGVWDAQTNAAYMQSRNNPTYTPVKNVYNENNEIDLTATIQAKIDQSRLTESEKQRASIVLEELEPDGKQWLKEQIDQVGLAAIFSQDSIEERLRRAFVEDTGFATEVPRSAKETRRLEQEAKLSLLEIKEARLMELNAYLNGLPAWEKTKVFEAARHSAEMDKLRVEKEIAALRQELGLPVEKSVAQKAAEMILAMMFPLVGCSPEQIEDDVLAISSSARPTPTISPSAAPSLSVAPRSSPYLYTPGVETPEAPAEQLSPPTSTPTVEECMKSPAKLTEEEKTMLAVVTAEANSWNPIMINAVAHVIMNRVNHKEYPESSPYESVTRGGFSGYRGKIYNNAITFFETGVYPEGHSGTTVRMEQVIQIGLPILRGDTSNDITNGCTEFRDPRRGPPSKAKEHPHLWEEIFIDGIDPNDLRFWRKIS